MKAYWWAYTVVVLVVGGVAGAVGIIVHDTIRYVNEEI